jgi:hypothetical protein
MAEVTVKQLADTVSRKASWKRSAFRKRKTHVKKPKKKPAQQRLSVRQKPSVAPMKND